MIDKIEPTSFAIGYLPSKRSVDTYCCIYIMEKNAFVQLGPTNLHVKIYTDYLSHTNLISFGVKTNLI